jgi:acyl-CoA reductase-like NAD-dependent aldehyde dehydrogenase
MKMLLAGEWVDREKTIEVRDPFDNSVVDTVPRGSAADVETALAAAVQGFETASSGHERAQMLSKTARTSATASSSPRRSPARSKTTARRAGVAAASTR